MFKTEENSQRRQNNLETEQPERSLRLKEKYMLLSNVASRKVFHPSNASFLLQETIYHYKERHDSAKVVFLDNSKAFDTVWHDGLLWKLHELNIHPSLWRIFCNTYTGMESCVLANNTYSSWFSLERGVRQGSVLSAKLYLVYINELLINLSQLKKGAFVLDLHLAAPTQADDISLISSITSHLQAMVSECETYSSKWQFTFSPAKSNVMVFNSRKKNNCIIKLYGKELPEVNGTRHVGIMLDANFNSCSRTSDSRSKIKASAMMLTNVGLHKSGLNPITSSNLVKSVCLPKALFGCELWSTMTKNDIVLIERAQRFCLKMCQGLPRTTRSDICKSFIGWLSAESYIDTRKLFFLGSLCNSRKHHLTYKLFITRLFVFRNCVHDTKIGFIPDVVRILKKYKLLQFLDNFISSGVFMSQTTWKKTVKDTIIKHEKSTWHNRLSSDPDLRHFRSIHPSIEPHPAWIIARRYPSLKNDCLSIVQICALWRPYRVYGLCDKCGLNCHDTLIHALTSCASCSEPRDELWCDIVNVGPVELSVELHNKADLDLVCSLLSCRPPVSILDEEAELYAKTLVKGICEICNA